MSSKLELITGRAPCVLIPPKIKAKMDAIIDIGHGNDELAWLGEVQRDGVDFVILDVHVPKQTVRPTTCDILEEGLAELVDKIGVERANRIRMWSHSHVNMGVSPSGTDDQQMKDFIKDIKDFFIRCIANKKGEYRFDIFLYDANIAIKDADWMLMLAEDRKQIEDEVKAELEGKFIEPKPPAGFQWRGDDKSGRYFRNGSYGSYGGYSQGAFGFDEDGGYGYNYGMDQKDPYKDPYPALEYSRYADIPVRRKKKTKAGAIVTGNQDEDDEYARLRAMGMTKTEALRTVLESRQVIKAASSPADAAQPAAATVS